MTAIYMAKVSMINTIMGIWQVDWVWDDIDVNERLHECLECGRYYRHEDKFANGKFCGSYFKSGCCEECTRKSKS